MLFRSIDWVYTLEQKIIGLPREDITLFFHVPVSVSQKLLTERASQTAKKKDMYEKNTLMLQEVEKLYASLGSRFQTWHSIECTKESQMRTREEIHEQVLDTLRQNKVL